MKIVVLDQNQTLKSKLIHMFSQNIVLTIDQVRQYMKTANSSPISHNCY